MRYMLLMADGGPPIARTEYQAWRRSQVESGVLYREMMLRPATEAVTVRVRDGEVVAAHGPYDGAAAQVGGCWVIDCSDLDEAIEIAAGHPAAATAPLEIRPFWED